MRKSTYESRMRLYIAVLITIGILVVINAAMYQNDTTPMHIGDLSDINEIHLVEVVQIEAIQPIIDLTEVAQITPPNPDNYDGQIVIATATEVITVQTVDGVKHFTNHMIG